MQKWLSLDMMIKFSFNQIIEIDVLCRYVEYRIAQSSQTFLGIESQLLKSIESE